MAALALLTLAGPALAQSGRVVPTAACGDDALIYDDAGDDWIASAGLAEGAEILGGSTWQLYGMLAAAAGDEAHGLDLAYKDALAWLQAQTRGQEKDLLEYLGLAFDRAAAAHQQDANLLVIDMVALQPDLRELRRTVRRLLVWIRVAQLQGPGFSILGMTLDQMQVEYAAARAELADLLDVRTVLRRDLEKLNGEVDALTAGALWAETMLCSLDG